MRFDEHAPQASSSSIAPVGLDVGEVTFRVRLDERRRHLRRYVAVAIAGCLAVLVAGVARRSIETSEQSERATLAPSTGLWDVERALGDASSAMQRAAATGTVRVDPRSLKRGVWIDGSAVTARQLVLPCGSHDVKIGRRGHARKLELPCGGEASVGR